MNVSELDKDIINLSKECISFDIENVSKWEIQFNRGIHYIYVNNGQKRFFEIARKYSTQEILPEELRKIFLLASLLIKYNPAKLHEILDALHEEIRTSPQNNTVLLPVSGIVVDEPFRIGDFTLFSKNSYIKSNADLSSIDVNRIEKSFSQTIAVTHFRSHPDSAKEIGIKKLNPELNRLKAFIPYLKSSLKYWIHPLTTSATLSDCFFVYGDYGVREGMSHLTEYDPLNIDAKDPPPSISFREFLENRMHFQDIVSGNSKFWKALRMGYEWLGKQYDEERLQNKLIYSIFALECLLSNSTNFSSITAAIAEKCAFLIGDTKEERLKIFSTAKKLYDMRSALAHGGAENSITEENVWQAFGLALAVYRKVTEMLVNKEISCQEDLDSYVMGKKFG